VRIGMLRKTVFLGLFSFLVVCSGCRDAVETESGDRSPEEVLRVSVAEAQLSPAPLFHEAVGTIKARVESTVSSQIMGTVTRIEAREGDRVEAGDPLALLDTRRVEARLAQAKAQLAQALKAQKAAASRREAARSEGELADVTYGRYLQMKEEEAVSPQEFDEVEARMRRAKAGLEQEGSMLLAAEDTVSEAVAGVSSAEAAFDDATVRAPYQGVVTAKMTDVGDLATPGKPLFMVEEANGFRVDVAVPEEHIHALAVGQEVTVRVPAMEDASITGRIDTIVPAAQPSTRTFLVKVALPDDIRLRSGMFARVTFLAGSKATLLIPASAVVQEGQLVGLFVLDDERTARLRLIRVGVRKGDMVEVLSGVQPGETCILAPPPGLTDGARVEPAP
jgi:RND family efflux transporter MFP subunit